MENYQPLARKYRPQKFKDVLGQEAIVTTLKNALRLNKVGHAYLFCGPRGTGKTTLARIFAKGINCENPESNCEPCNCCTSCKGIISGNSLDVLEIDGASNRGIDDIRKINETVIYSAPSGKYKIYIIDEVHMLTKDAFNALLKTLEEPPPNVKFLFATTEAHKVLPTIISRCQRFNLNRISQKTIVEKLKAIALDINAEIEEAALKIIAHRAEGGLRDAESLMDQILSFHDEGKITEISVADLFGMVSSDVYLEMDLAGIEGNLIKAFEIAERVFSQGKDFKHFIEGLVDHFRNLLLIKLAGKDSALLVMGETLRERYQTSAALYSKEQCLSILDFLMEREQQSNSSDRISLENLLLYILRSHQRIPIEILVRRLSELEQRLSNNDVNQSRSKTIEQPKTIEQSKKDIAPVPPTIMEDPTPTLKELGKTIATVKTVAAPPKEKEKQLQKQVDKESLKEPYHGHCDTLMHFAAVELQGKIQKKQRSNL